eukprot:GHVP01026464.1.p1 GENE.GHVP01026464.1~~GHVP01026464.1.p1  ORF type:complete len:839 (+),score=157.35 GHVP01026464.1:197-2518(+)
MSLLYLHHFEPQDLEKIKEFTEELEIDTQESDKSISTPKPQEIENFLETIARKDIRFEVLQETRNLNLAWLAFKVLNENHAFTSDPTFRQRCSIREYHPQNFLRLDCSAIEALNLITLRKKNSKSGGQNIKSCKFLKGVGSLYSLLNQCRTAIGSRRLERWILQPSNNEAEINERLMLVESLNSNEHLRRCIQFEHLKRVVELDKLVLKMHKVSKNDNAVISWLASQSQEVDVPSSSKGTSKGVILTLEDLVKLYDCLIHCHGLLVTLKAFTGLHSEVVAKVISAPLEVILSSAEKFLDLIEHSVDLEEAKRRNYIINRKLNAEFAELADEMESKRAEIESYRDEVEDTIGLKGTGRKSVGGETQAVKLMDFPGVGLVFRVTRKDMPVVTNRKEFKAVRTNKTEFQFTSPKLQKFNKEMSKVSSNYEAQGREMKAKVLSIAGTYWPVIEQLAEILSTIDILCAFSQVSTSALIPYTKPNVTNASKVLEIVRGRHPLLESSSSLESQTFVANSISMRIDGPKLLIITGPNMGGKSTYLRQSAVIILLSQIGCFVPCDSATIPIFNEIFCRVGSSDNPSKGISTFMGEMLSSSTIVKGSGPRSFIVIDELGRGTSTYEGFGLAWAIAQYLAEENQSWVAFATHFHEMGAMEEEVHLAKNLHFSAHVEGSTVRFEHKILEGPAGKSLGVHVATKAKFPLQTIEAALQKAAELERAEKIQLFRSATAQRVAKRRRDGTEDENILDPKLNQIKQLLIESSTFDEFETKRKEVSAEKLI